MQYNMVYQFILVYALLASDGRPVRFDNIPLTNASNDLNLDIINNATEQYGKIAKDKGVLDERTGAVLINVIRLGPVGVPQVAEQTTEQPAEENTSDQAS